MNGVNQNRCQITSQGKTHLTSSKTTIKTTPVATKVQNHHIGSQEDCHSGGEVQEPTNGQEKISNPTTNPQGKFFLNPTIIYHDYINYSVNRVKLQSNATEQGVVKLSKVRRILEIIQVLILWK